MTSESTFFYSRSAIQIHLFLQSAGWAALAFVSRSDSVLISPLEEQQLHVTIWRSAVAREKAPPNARHKYLIS